MGQAARKAGIRITVPAYDLDAFRAQRRAVDDAPTPIDAFVVLWGAVTQTQEKANQEGDLDLWVSVRQKLRAVEHRITDLQPGRDGAEEVTLVFPDPEGVDMELTAPETALVQRLWTAARKELPLSRAELRLAVDALVWMRKPAIVPAGDGEGDG